MASQFTKGLYFKRLSLRTLLVSSKWCETRHHCIHVYAKLSYKRRILFDGFVVTHPTPCNNCHSFIIVFFLFLMICTFNLFVIVLLGNTGLVKKPPGDSYVMTPLNMFYFGIGIDPQEVIKIIQSPTVPFIRLFLVLTSYITKVQCEDPEVDTGTLLNDLQSCSIFSIF